MLKTQLTTEEIKELEKAANNARISVLKMIHNAKSGHLGGSFSAVEIILTLYKKILHHNNKWTESPNFQNRDRFVLSKGHAAPILYHILAEEGYFDKSELMTLRQVGSNLQGHPCCLKVNGVDISTGSLGQGLSIACGMALGLRLNQSNAFVYVYMGDGELQEGQVYEGMMSAAHKKLGRLIAIVDRNCYQIDGHTECVKSVDPIDKKFESFGWQVLNINGHNIKEIFNAFQEAKILGVQNQKPVVIIADTVKGKGVSFMENTCSWHGKAPCDEEFETALKELEGRS
ncbi:MAG: transketolase [Candidatus Gastranaerophilales bacterium]|nr:transketolase [Candidatus Gastranaerophilales bacterium]